MSAVTNTFLTGAAIGNREDLSDLIYRIAPTDTPFLSGVSRETATAVNHEWQKQDLAAVAANAQPEGDDLLNGLTINTVTPTVRNGNICQISRKSAIVSNTQQSVIHAGRANEMDYQVMLKGLELKRDMENALLAGNSAGGIGVAKASTDPRNLASIQSWIKVNTSTTGTDPTADDGTSARVAGTARAFTEILLKQVLSKIWTSGGKPDVLMTGAFNKQAFSTFTGRATPIEQTTSRKIVAAVDAYESDFGTLKVIPNRFMAPSQVLALEMEKWAVAFLKGRNMVSIPLAPTGDNQKRMVVSEYTLVARNEAASGIVADLTTS